MTGLVTEYIEEDGIQMSNPRLQPLMTWLVFLNFITIAVLALLFLKIYRALLLLFNRLFRFQKPIRTPIILIIGPKTEIIEEIIFQLSEKFSSEIVNFQDGNDNETEILLEPKQPKKSRILCSHEPIHSQEKIGNISKKILYTYGVVDVLLIAQNEDVTTTETPHSFINHLNEQLLIQFWTVMAFLPEMLKKNNGHIISVALGRSSLTNTGIIRTVQEDLQQSETKVKLTLVERNLFLENYFPPLPTDILAKLIIRSIWCSDSVVNVPSVFSYFIALPILITRILKKPFSKLARLIFQGT